MLYNDQLHRERGATEYGRINIVMGLLVGTSMEKYTFARERESEPAKRQGKQSACNGAHALMYRYALAIFYFILLSEELHSNEYLLQITIFLF